MRRRRRRRRAADLQVKAEPGRGRGLLTSVPINKEILAKFRITEEESAAVGPRSRIKPDVRETNNHLEAEVSCCGSLGYSGLFWGALCPPNAALRPLIFLFKSNCALLPSAGRHRQHKWI